MEIPTPDFHFPQWQIDMDFVNWATDPSNKRFGIRFGQYFCNKYGIHGLSLFYIENPEECKKYIETFLKDKE